MDRKFEQIKKNNSQRQHGQKKGKEYDFEEDERLRCRTSKTTK